MRVIILATLVLPCLHGQVTSSAREILGIEDSLSTDNLDSASKLVEEALRSHPGDGGLLNLRGVVHARRDELDAARRDFAAAVRVEPGLTPAWQNLGRACQMLAARDASGLDCALRAWARVVALKPEDQEARASLGLLYERSGQFERSLEQLGKLRAAAADETSNLTLRCADLSALGRKAEARETAPLLAARDDLSEQDLEAAGNAFDRGDPETAITLIESLDKRQAAGLATLKRLALAYEKADRPVEARAVLERVAALDSTNPAHLIEMARLANAAKDYEGALGYLAHARDIAPQNAGVHYLFAMDAAKLELVVEARQSLGRALAIEPDNPEYNYAMGAMTIAAGDFASAAGYLQKFVNAEPGNVNGRFALGVAYFSSHDYEKARNEMTPLQRGPKSAEAKYYLGRIAHMEGQTGEAIALLKESIASRPKFVDAHTELARLYLLQNDLQKAGGELHEAVDLDPRNFQANSQLLVLYNRAHDPRAAAQQTFVEELDKDRLTHSELMLRTLEFRP